MMNFTTGYYCFFCQASAGLYISSLTISVYDKFLVQ